MSKTIITFNEVIELNQIFKDKGFNYKIHLHDRCGSQSFSIETVGSEEQDQKEMVKMELIKYFDQKGNTLRFSENGLEFSIM